MGLFDFVKAAGEKLFGAGDAAAAEPAKAAKALSDHVKQQGIGVGDDLEIIWIDGKAKVSGTAATQADKEKAILAIGNVEGVAAVEDNIQVTSTGERPARMVTVKKGDTLSAIAKTAYGNANKYMLIFKANQPMLSHPDKIYPGQVLRIPELD